MDGRYSCTSLLLIAYVSRACVHACAGAIAEEEPERPSSVTRSVSGQLGTELLMRAYSSTSDAFRLEDLEEKLEDVSRVYMAVFKLFVTHAVPNYQQPWAKQQVRPCHPPSSQQTVIHIYFICNISFLIGASSVYRHAFFLRVIAAPALRWWCAVYNRMMPSTAEQYIHRIDLSVCFHTWDRTFISQPDGTCFSKYLNHLCVGPVVQQTSSIGTGFAIDVRSRRFLTNAHCVDNAGLIYIYIYIYISYQSHYKHNLYITAHSHYMCVCVYSHWDSHCGLKIST